jgi:Protein of unknown function (DUF2786)
MQANGKFYPTTLLIEVWWLGTDQPVMMKAAGFVPNEYGDAWVRQCKTQEEFDKWRSHSIALIKRFNGQAVDVAQWRPRQPEPTPVDMESIANKIKKLLALSQSPNEAEAIAASKKAQELLTRHNLSMADLADSSQEDVEEYELSSQLKGDRWRESLIDGVADANFCEFLTRTTRGKGSTYILIGRPSNCKVAALQYEYLCKTVERLANEAINETGEKGFRNAFRVGCARRIQVRLREAIKEQCSQGVVSNDGNISAIVMRSLFEQRQAEIKQYISSELGRVRYVNKSTSISSSSGYAAGDRAGQSVSLNKQVSCSSQRYLGGRLE